MAPDPVLKEMAIMARILIIDDDESLLQMMSIMLKRAGHTPILATDGYKGIEIARRERPDMAIVDVMMPDISGYEVCRILREDPETMDIPLLILTALSQPEQRDYAEDAGADDFVTKPVTRDDLLKHVEELLYTGARNMPAPLEPPAPPPVTEAPAPPPPPQPRTAPPPSPAQPPQPVPSAGVYQPPAPRPETPTPALPVVAVMGLADGVGTTTMAVNLGLGLMQFGRSCIVDLNNGDGQVAVQLKMTPPKSTWYNLVNLAPGADKRLIGGALMLDRSVGVAILAAPLDPAPQELAPETLQYIFSVLSEGFHRIVVDLPAHLTPMSTHALRLASHIVLVVGENPADLVTVPKTLEAIDRLGLKGQQHIVINRTRPHGVSHEDVVKTINRPIEADIPYEPDQISALMEGRPLVMSQPGSLFARAILHLARQL